MAIASWVWASQTSSGVHVPRGKPKCALNCRRYARVLNSTNRRLAEGYPTIQTRTLSRREIAEETAFVVYSVDLYRFHTNGFSWTAPNVVVTLKKSQSEFNLLDLLLKTRCLFQDCGRHED